MKSKAKLLKRNKTLNEKQAQVTNKGMEHCMIKKHKLPIRKA